MLETDKGRPQTSECTFMKLPKCQLQDVTKRLDIQICQACIAGRTERHIFEVKEILVKLLGAKAHG